MSSAPCSNFQKAVKLFTGNPSWKIIRDEALALFKNNPLRVEDTTPDEKRSCAVSRTTNTYYMNHIDMLMVDHKSSCWTTNGKKQENSTIRIADIKAQKLMTVIVYDEEDGDGMLLADTRDMNEREAEFYEDSFYRRCARARANTKNNYEPIA